MNPQTNKETQKTTMVAPPQENTKMVAPVKTVKIEVLRPICRGQGLEQRFHVPGETVEVTEEEANMFCKPFQGGFAFGGERSVKDSPKHEIVRAKRVV